MLGLRAQGTQVESLKNNFLLVREEKKKKKVCKMALHTWELSLSYSHSYSCGEWKVDGGRV